MKQVRDTSQDYQDLVGYKAKETIPTDLSTFLGIEQELKPVIKPKPVDPDFPEEWQNLYVNLRSEEDYIKFMKLIGEVPSPKTSVIVYSEVRNDGLLNFFGDDE